MRLMTRSPQQTLQGEKQVNILYVRPDGSGYADPNSAVMNASGMDHNIGKNIKPRSA